MSIFHRFKDWLIVLCLALAGFIFVTTELMPIGLLPDIAEAMGKSEASTGLLITVYAWAVALTSLPLTMFFARYNRRRLVLVLITFFTISQWMAALADSFAFLMAARIVISLCHALFWAIVPPLAVRVAPNHAATKALSLLAMVTSLGSILGMPIGAMIGHQFGWRLTFALVGVVSLVIGVVLFKFLPSAPAKTQKSEGPGFKPWREPEFQKIYWLTALTVVGHFTAFTYMNPLLVHGGGFSPNTVSWLLLTLGGAGIMGNMIVGRFFDRRPETCLVAALTILALSLLLSRLMSGWLITAILLCLGWGASMSASVLMLQTTIIKKSQDSPDVANSLFSSTFNFGVGTGALAGKKLFDLYGIGTIAYGGSAFAFLAALSALFFILSARRKSS